MQGHQGAETDDVIMSDADKKVVLKTGKFFDASGYVPEGWCAKLTHQPRVMLKRYTVYCIELNHPTPTAVASIPNPRWN